MPAGGRIGARPFAGARVVLGLAIAALLSALPAQARARGAPPSGPLPWRVGGETGFTVDAASFPDSAGWLLEVYLRIRPATLRALGKGRDERNRFQLAIRLDNAFGKKEHDLVQDFTVSPGDTVGGYGKVIMFPIRTRPGVHRLKVKMMTRRPPAAPGLTGRIQTESIDGEVVVPGPQADRDLSSVEFVWSEPFGTVERGFQRAGRGIVPNPERLYGLYADSLRAEIVARGKAGDERPWHWVARVLDAGNRPVSTVEATGPAGQWLHAPIVMDVSSRPAGGYDLEVKAWQEGDAGALLRRSRFSVAWQPESWTHSPQDILDDAHFLLPPEEEETFGQLQPGEQERVMGDFWRKRDPTPETAENEVRRTFLERVDFANRTFGRRGLGKGMFSDMGRVFIRYGEPGEVLRQVIPTLDNTLAEVIQQLAARDQREVGGVEQRQLGADMRPFELWIYEGEIPLPPDADPTVQRATRTRKRLVFLFVDEQWVGDYRLRYTTE